MRNDEIYIVFFYSMKISNGANVNKIWKGVSPLLLACEGTCGVGVVQALLGHSAKINEKNIKLETPLHVAARYFHPCSIF
jgi:ankyrin repeat protein